MKKFLPFVFPALSLLIVIFLAYRWYSNRTERGQIPPFAENATIEELSETEEINNLTGVSDFESLSMESTDGASQGELRYDFEDGKIRFTVMAGLSDEDADYQVWLKDPDSEAVRKAFDLEFKKGGFVGSAAISTETLPFEVLVTLGELKPDMSNVILKAILEAQN